ncbi:hypothetical protein BP354E_4941 [Burkholderia pseudomallei 354e]|uniref:hypothetical protein n=2 Tax=Burkholderia pseudomallei TaxID=28450 RepID=UPI00025C3370|nr:hypothetical protein [Burkholderia pseudomallei]EIF70907.1 hypothetical protein BP354E_4941 [Burkholderia pseudomallei 354e]MDY7816323.1 hypothetical protein [Burkholderia pseudomallei]MDY7863016.1 hypothetical protein [Burkholderia pseudomallei]
MGEASGASPLQMSEDNRMIVDRRTRDINRYLSHLNQDETYYLGLRVRPEHAARVAALGFSSPLIPGERLLPPARAGAASRRNADGFDIVHRDRPKETAYRQISWTYSQWHGDRQVEVTEVKDVPYTRYPRTKVPPYSIELVISTDPHGGHCVVTGPFRRVDEQTVVATNTANMLVEQLGSFEVLDASLQPNVHIPVRRLNWKLLPQGRNTWQSAWPSLEAVIQRSRGKSQEVIEARFVEVGKYNPEFIAVGLGGFDDYVVFGFPSKDICVLESRFTNNATYVLAHANWEVVSQMTKAEILSASAHEERLIHDRTWFVALAEVLGRPSANAA